MTSGASEMIFMNFFSRNSRATGPKMRVPLRIQFLVNDHHGVAVKPQIRTVIAADRLARAHHHRVTTSPFFTGRPAWLP